MKKTWIALLVLCVISSFFMGRFYFAIIDIRHEYVNENTLIYLNSMGNIENLPQWPTMKDLWKDTQPDFLIRFIFLIVIIWVIIKSINRRETMILPLFTALALSIVSFFLMIFYFLASSDIYNEYVNKTIFTAVNSMANMKPFPEWASTSLEWGIVIADFILRAMFMFYISVLLVILILEDRKQFAHK